MFLAFLLAISVLFFSNGISVNANTSLAATVEVEPDELNLKSKGNWTTTYIELPTGD